MEALRNFKILFDNFKAVGIRAAGN